MYKDKITFLKKKWLKNNIFMIIVTVIIVAVIYVIAMIFHNLYLVLFNIVFSFAAYFYYRNKMMIYVEENLYK